MAIHLLKLSGNKKEQEVYIILRCFSNSLLERVALQLHLNAIYSL